MCNAVSSKGNEDPRSNPTSPSVCPSCDTYTGTINVVCGYDGVTYSSECDLFIALCQSGLITLGEGTDIKWVHGGGGTGGYRGVQGGTGGYREGYREGYPPATKF